MGKYRLGFIVGSLRKDSFNRRLALAMVRMAPADFSCGDIPIGDLPLYDQDDDATPVAPVRRLREQVAAAACLLFVTPEYNRSIPGVLKNAIDHGSRPYGSSVWAGKPAGVLGVSVGPMGTCMAQQHLRNVLACLDVPTLAQPEAYLQAGDGLFDAAGDIGIGSRALLQGWMDRYAAWVRRIAA